MSKRESVMAVVLDVINEVRRTGLTCESVEPDFYLGGDLGVESREMLEIWYELENRLHIRVEDSEKRDLYTLGDVVGILNRKLELQAAAA
jgi:acyl carrier protein